MGVICRVTVAWECNEKTMNQFLFPSTVTVTCESVIGDTRLPLL